MHRKKIKEIVNKIKEKFNPQKIILFGSYAWGRPTEDSDIDLFIVMESNLRRDERARDILGLFSERLFAMDVIVYTPEELKLSLKRGNLFIEEILNKGKLLYG
ncbi:MAG: nucleotidyltransferase domain-containing protein [Candidatus Omnitrophica bacterium]|nr:nucleotidyltransferase domain-containing protein [Candidatus Omnitrophota bacterium]